MPSRWIVAAKSTPLAPSLAYAIDFAFRSVRLNASLVPMSGFRAPLRTASASPDRATCARVSPEILPAAMRSSTTAGVRNATSNASPPLIRWPSEAANPYVTTSLLCVALSNFGPRSSRTAFRPFEHRTVMSSAAAARVSGARKTSATATAETVRRCAMRSSTGPGPASGGPLRQLGANNLRPGGHCAHLAVRDVPRQVLHPAVGCDDDVFGLDVRQRAADARGDRLARLDGHVGQIDRAEQDLLVRQPGEHGAIEIRLRRFDRHLIAAAVGELGQKRIARRALVDDRGVAEADVHDRRAGDPLERAVQRLEPVLPRLLGTRLHVRFVHL